MKRYLHLRYSSSFLICFMKFAANEIAQSKFSIHSNQCVKTKITEIFPGETNEEISGKSW